MAEEKSSTDRVAQWLLGVAGSIASAFLIGTFVWVWTISSQMTELQLQVKTNSAAADAADNLKDDFGEMKTDIAVIREQMSTINKKLDKIAPN